MLVLRAFVEGGVVPLLGPPTSIGGFNHGALYYWLLAPVVAVFGPIPTAVATAIALAGIAAVAVMWWLARSMAGPIAGLTAALVMAVSPAAVEESTFIWNPNLVALASSVALAAAWRAWTVGAVRWWLLAAAGVAVTMQCHVLGAALLVPVGGLLVADARRRTGDDRRRTILAGVAAIGIIALTYVPLAVHELGHDFGETRAALAFLAGGAEPSPVSLPVRLLVVTVRVLSWPLVGLLTDAPAAAISAAALVVAILAWRTTRAGGDERQAARWLAASLAWSIVALTFAAGGLATVVPGLPTDHYHAFADPMVYATVGLGMAAAWPLRDQAARPVGRVVGIGILALVLGWGWTHQPPAVAAGGAWPGARDAANRVLATTGDRPILLWSLPRFKAPDALGFPLTVAGADVTPVGGPGHPDPGLSPTLGANAALVVMCDGRFAEAIGAGCDGPAEDGLAGSAAGSALRLTDRFEMAPDRWVSVYLP
jgi:4-amino-4-deoxy-L-arabinose transferase-like glycosyltransferase